MLNFDPHRWLAERETEPIRRPVATVATVATPHPQSKTPFLADVAATVATAATTTITESGPTLALREWHTHLVKLDVYAMPAGFNQHRWAMLVEDAWWIYEHFASRAVRDGWSAHDLFGVFVPRPGWGGLCDRIMGARNLKMAGRRAVWSRWGIPDWTCIGAGDSLVSSGIKLIWELEPRHDQAEK